MNAYELRDVSFSYHERVALANVNLDVPRGLVTALVGPNGSGKTTLLHLLAFLETPATGRIRFLGEPVPARRFSGRGGKVGLVLQNPYLFRGSVKANVAWGLRISGFSERECLPRAGEAIEAVGLRGFENRSAQRLSGGEAQRVALARVLALEPHVVLLDEPTNHVDEATRVDVESLLRNWVRDRGTTVVLATHDLALARRMEATVWRLEQGRVRRGQSDNVFRGRPVAGEPGVFDGGRLRIHVHPLPASSTCVEVSPREVVLSAEAHHSSARNVLTGTVVSAEVVGGEAVRVVLDCGEHVVAVVTRASWENLGVTLGRAAVASFKATSVRAY